MAQGHLNSLGDAFHEISKTSEGQVLLGSMEGLATRIKVGLGADNPLKTTCNGYFFQTEGSFKDAVKVCFRLAKKITGNPWVQVRDNWFCTLVLYYNCPVITSRVITYSEHLY